MNEQQKVKIQAEIKGIVTNIYYIYNQNKPDVITVIARFVEDETEKVKNPKPKKQQKHSGVLRNDLAGFARVRGNKIYIRYKGKDYSTGYNDTTIGWKLANDWWAEKLDLLAQIEAGIIKEYGTVSDALDKFITYKKVIQKLTDRTIKEYRFAVKKVFGDLNLTLNEKNIKIALENYIKTDKTSSVTINSVLKRLQVFLTWCSDDDNQYIQVKNYTKKYKQPEPKTIKPPYTVEEYKMFLEFLNKDKHKEFSLFIQFLWETGARVGEALNIKVSEIDFKNSWIVIPNKIFKSQQEVLLLSDVAVAVVKKVLSLRKTANDKLFSWKTTDSIKLKLSITEKELGIKIRGRGFHGFRRAFTDRLIKSGITIEKAQQILRHRNIQTTETSYLNMYKSELLEEINSRLGC